MPEKIKIDTWIRQMAVNDDQRALRYLFEHFYPKLANFARYVLESNSAADEVISNVFIGLWNNRARLEKIENFNAYIFRSVKNKCLSYLRDIQRLNEDRLIAGDSMLTKTVNNPESKLINLELRKEILMALDELPPRCRLIFELVKQDGFKYKEVAELLEISSKTVENQMGKAMTSLRSKLKRHYYSDKTRNLNSSDGIA